MRITNITSNQIHIFGIDKYRDTAVKQLFIKGHMCVYKYTIPPGGRFSVRTLDPRLHRGN